MDRAFTAVDLNEAINATKIKGAPGLDNFTPNMLLNLDSNNMNHLLNLYNHSEKSEQVPQSCRNSKIVPILRKAKIPLM